MSTSAIVWAYAEERFIMKRLSILAAVSAVAVALVAPSAAFASVASRALPTTDLFWTVNDTNGNMVAMNPNTHNVIKSIVGPEGSHSEYIGGTWDQSHKRFILVDGWGGDNQGIDIYSTSSRSWTRYAIHFGADSDSSAFEVRDVVATRTGKIALLAWDVLNSENLLIYVTDLNSSTHVASADAADSTTETLWETDGAYSSIAFDPASDQYLYALTYGYDLQRLKTSTGYLVSRHPVSPAASESDHFDIDSSRHYWAFGNYGVELSWGVLSTSLSNVDLASTGFTATTNCFIIQHKYVK